jgi:hypothetical protein
MFACTLRHEVVQAAARWHIFKRKTHLFFLYNCGCAMNMNAIGRLCRRLPGKLSGNPEFDIGALADMSKHAVI